VPNKVHSFDLVAANERVTACNISRVPLPNASLDVAIFCLSLMGVDFIKFIHEAHRTLKQGSGTQRGLQADARGAPFGNRHLRRSRLVSYCSPSPC
jgi:hypothetical protein